MKQPIVAERRDPVNPAYYQGDYVMRVIEDFELDFLLGTVTKYVLRAGKKHADGERMDDKQSTLVDLRKAEWYLKRKIENLEKDAKQ